MIQDISPHIYHFEQGSKQPAADDIILCYDGESVFVRQHEGQISFPLYCDFKVDIDLIYLFNIDEARFFLYKDADRELLAEFSTLTLAARSKIHMAEPHWLGFAAVTGLHLNRWYQNRSFCGKCGSKMLLHGSERSLICTECGLTEYPKISPAVIVAITDGDRLLLSRYANRPYRRFALIAGFTEVGEPIEETVAREVMEEVGLKVTNLRFYKSQPWGLTDSLLLGFFCDLVGDDKITLSTDELAEACWFERDNLPLNETTHISLTQEMIELFRAGQEPK